ncbi:Rieske (2Fe-2S) protein [Solimonas variicoloris]|uniref:Rieske (2Fe-2S) protein n=1 Tax=Solimonas variicoloris TaxID=254408 RepID=UPI00037330A2|nr:Rieske (2Fe-2S) protein [Solimonas variicoloris]
MSEQEIARSEQVRENAVHLVRLGKQALLLSRVDGVVHAVENRCPHLGLPLARGEVADGAIRCPFHGSRFSLCDGRNLDWVNALGPVTLPEWSRRLVALGKQPTGLQTFAVRERDGAVYLEL